MNKGAKAVEKNKKVMNSTSLSIKSLMDMDVIMDEGMDSVEREIRVGWLTSFIHGHSRFLSLQIAHTIYFYKDFILFNFPFIIIIITTRSQVSKKFCDAFVNFTPNITNILYLCFQLIINIWYIILYNLSILCMLFFFSLKNIVW